MSEAVMALDVGAKRIGVAIAQGGLDLAVPLETIERTNVASDLERIVALARTYGATEIVVGDPITLAGQRGIASGNMDAFVARLERVFPGTVHRMDERLTTAQATKTLVAADVSRRKRKGAVDRIAAALILESFLGRRRR